MTTYSIPVSQTTLTQFMVEVTTEQGEDYAYFLFQDPDEGDHPGTLAMNWCNEDEAENESDDTADSYFITEHGVFDNPECDDDEIINKGLERFYGEGVKIVGDRIEVDNLEYAFIPGCFDIGLYGEDELQEWANDYNLDLKVLVA